MTSYRRRLLLAAVLVAAPMSASAQTVLVRVFDDEAQRPMVGALAYLKNASGQTAKNALTDELGRALFVGIPAGAYRVEVEMIGRATASTELFDISEGTTISHEVRMESSAIQLEGIEIELEGGRCSIRPGGEGLLVAEVWDEARKALSAASFTDQRGSYRYETMRYERQIDRSTGVVLMEDQQRREGYMRTPFESRPAADLADNGYVQPDGREFLYYAPDATVLLSDPFLDAHCFRMADGRNEEGMIGLRFEPTGDRKNVPDIQGVMWLDPETAELQWLDFQYRYLEPEMMTDMVGGRVDFRRMPDGTWIVPEWWIRMPVMSSQTDFQGRQRRYIARYQMTGGLVLEVREAGGRSLGQRAETGGVEGVVMDSIGVPLRGVRVGVVGSNQEVFSNAEGRFSITGLTEGRYQVRFVGARLESMGYIPEPVTRDVIRGELTYMEYVTPSIGDVLFAACRGVERDSDTVILAGTVVDEQGRAAPGATVRVSWTGYRLAGGGNEIDPDLGNVTETVNGFETASTPTGFFSFCGVPANTRMRLYAELGGEETPEYEVEIYDYETGALKVLHLGGS